MNIASTRSASRLTQNSPRRQAQQAYNEARQEMQQATDAYFSAIDRKENAVSRNALIGGGVGLGVAVAALVATGVGIEHYSVIAAPAMLGGIIAGFGTSYMMNKPIKQELQPKFSEGWGNLVEKRENYRNELLKELNDDGVREITQPRWDAGKDSYYSHTIVKMNEQVDQLTKLADARQQQNWQGDLARTEDDPAAFVVQEQFVADNASLKEVLEKKCM